MHSKMSKSRRLFIFLYYETGEFNQSKYRMWGTCIKAYQLLETKGHLSYSLAKIDDFPKIKIVKKASPIFNGIKTTNTCFSDRKTRTEILMSSMGTFAAVRMYLGEIANVKTYQSRLRMHALFVLERKFPAVYLLCE